VVQHAAGACASAGPQLLVDEVTVVIRAQGGNVDAFETLIDTYQTPLFRYALRLLDDRGSAEDVVQETFVAAWRGLPTLADPGAFRGWLYRITTRRAFDVLRARRPQAEWPDEDHPAAPAAPAHHDPAQTVVHRSQFEALQQHVARLPPQQRAAWTMQIIDGLSYAEIAVALNLPLSTVRGRISRARRTLAERMSSWR
jgi:RNA polymerase sigma-70 factor (ECF subfamily)